MKSLIMLVSALLFLAQAAPVGAQQDTEEYRARFESVVKGLNGNSFKQFHEAVSRPALIERILAGRIIAQPVREALERDFSNTIQSLYTGSFPRSSKDITGTVVAFDVSGQKGRAVVRFDSGGYRYSYHVYELALGDGGRIAIIDWQDYFAGSLFSDLAGDTLAMAMPTKPAVRQMIRSTELTEAQAFQVGELFKAVRDQRADRYFQIHDDLDETVRKDPLVIRTSGRMAAVLNQRERYEQAMSAIESQLGMDPLQSLNLAVWHIGAKRFEDAIIELDRLADSLGSADGVIGTFRATAAMALGEFDRAERYALEATAAEPGLEVGWWALLRVRTAAENYGAATEVLTRLEDDFGLSLTPEKLGKDRFLRVLTDKQEYLDWRASR